MVGYMLTVTALLICVAPWTPISAVQNRTVTLQALETRLANLEGTVEQLSQRECACYGRSSDTIAFSVYMDTPAVPSHAHAVIPFARVTTNVGSGYRSTSSSFMAPTDGVYVFFAHLDASTTYKAFNIVVNGKDTKATAHNDADDHSLSTSVILVLKAGDRVDVRHERDEGQIDGGPESIFTGFRLGNIPESAAPIIG